MTIYRVVHSLTELLSLPFAFPAERKHYHPVLPETTLLALIVVAAKLLYPFDPEQPYVARSLTDISLLSLPWPVWSKAQQDYDRTTCSKQLFGKGSQMLAEERDAVAFSKNEMDEWMDWYTKTWLKGDSARNTKFGRHKPRIPEAIMNMFSIEFEDPEAEVRAESLKQRIGKQNDMRREADDKRIQTVMEAMESRDIIDDDSRDKRSLSILRAGERYEVFVREEELYGYAKEFHERVAERGTISVHRLINAVLLVERRIKAVGKKRQNETDEAKHDEEEVIIKTDDGEG